MGNELKDWEEMRHQMEVLKKKLERQQIINENTLRQAMRDKGRGIHRRLATSIAIAAFAALFCPVAFHAIGVAWLFGIVTSAYMATAIIYTIYMRRGIHPSIFTTENLVDVARQASRIKRQEHFWLWRFEIPFLIVWFPWLGYEIIRSHNGDMMYVIVLLFSVVLGGVIGGVVGSRMSKRNISDAEDILNHIKDLTEKEDNKQQ